MQVRNFFSIYFTNKVKKIVKTFFKGKQDEIPDKELSLLAAIYSGK
jgi:hypothetical protein